MPQPDIMKSVCEICLNNCGVDAWVVNGELVKIEGSCECFNKGKLCPKGYFMREYVHRDDRVKTPLRRVGERGEGKFEQISWDEAYDEIATRLNDIKARYGADAVAFYTGYSKWYRTMLHRFAHSFGTRNYGTESSSCFQAMRMANVLCSGTLNRPDLDNADVYLAWGFNPFHSSVYDFGYIDDLREQGLKLVVVDPKVTPASQLADLHVQLKAGTDGALALYLGNYLIEHDAIDRDYVDLHVHGFDEYAAYVREFTLERTADITGLDPAVIEQLGRLLVENPRFTSSITAAPLTHHRNGVQSIRAILSLSAITGNYDRDGGLIPLEFSDPRVNADSEIGDGTFIDESRPADAKPRIGAGRFPVWAHIVDEFQAMDLSRQILEGTPYPIKALFGLGVNVRMFPGNEKLIEAIRQLEFFVDVDIFHSETSRYADILLPACTSLERSQFQGGFMGMYNNPGTVRYLKPAIKPLYESKSDADILCDLAVRLGYDDPVLTRGYDACSRYLLRKVGVTLAELKATSATARIPGKDPYYPGDNTAFGYRTPTGKFELTSEILREYGYDPLPVWTPSADDADPEQFPLQLTAGARLPWQFHSRFQHSALKQAFQPHPAIDINPVDARVQGIRHGDAVKLETAWGAIELEANVTHAVAPGAVFVFQDYPGADVNSIIGPDHLDPISGFPAFRAIRCRVQKAKAQPARTHVKKGA